MVPVYLILIISDPFLPRLALPSCPTTTMKKLNGKQFEANTVVAAILLLPHAFVSALFFGPTPEPSICSVQTVYVRALPSAPTPPGGGGGGGGGYSFNLPDVRKDSKALFTLFFSLFFFFQTPSPPHAQLCLSNLSLN